MTRIRIVWFVFGILLVSIAAQPAGAVVVYSEDVSGDLPDDFDDVPIPPILPMGPGDNVIFGEILPPLDNSDAFNFETEEERILNGILIQLTAPAPVDIEVEIRELIGSLNEVIRSWHFPDAEDLDVDLRDTPPTVGPPLDDLAGGMHGMRMKALEDPAYSITFSFTPEPSSLSLASLLLVCVAIRRRGRA
jgi:hypothetical protein